MKTEFEKSIKRLSFLCSLKDIKIAWINPWLFVPAVSFLSDLHISKQGGIIQFVCMCVCVCVFV